MNKKMSKKENTHSRYANFSTGSIIENLSDFDKKEHLDLAKKDLEDNLKEEEKMSSYNRFVITSSVGFLVAYSRLSMNQNDCFFLYITAFLSASALLSLLLTVIKFKRVTRGLKPKQFYHEKWMSRESYLIYDNLIREFQDKIDLSQQNQSRFKRYYLFSCYSLFSAVFLFVVSTL